MPNLDPFCCCPGCGRCDSAQRLLDLKIAVKDLVGFEHDCESFTEPHNPGERPKPCAFCAVARMAAL